MLKRIKDVCSFCLFALIALAIPAIAQDQVLQIDFEKLSKGEAIISPEAMQLVRKGGNFDAKIAQEYLEKNGKDLSYPSSDKLKTLLAEEKARQKKIGEGVDVAQKSIALAGGMFQSSPYAPYAVPLSITIDMLHKQLNEQADRSLESIQKAIDSVQVSEDAIKRHQNIKTASEKLTSGAISIDEFRDAFQAEIGGESIAELDQLLVDDLKIKETLNNLVDQTKESFGKNAQQLGEIYSELSALRANQKKLAEGFHSFAENQNQALKEMHGSISKLNQAVLEIEKAQGKSEKLLQSVAMRGLLEARTVEDLELRANELVASGVSKEKVEGIVNPLKAQLKEQAFVHGLDQIVRDTDTTFRALKFVKLVDKNSQFAKNVDQVLLWAGRISSLALSYTQGPFAMANVIMGFFSGPDSATLRHQEVMDALRAQSELIMKGFNQVLDSISKISEQISAMEKNIVGRLDRIEVAIQRVDEKLNMLILSLGDVFSAEFIKEYKLHTCVSLLRSDDLSKVDSQSAVLVDFGGVKNVRLLPPEVLYENPYRGFMSPAHKQEFTDCINGMEKLLIALASGSEALARLRINVKHPKFQDRLELFNYVTQSGQRSDGSKLLNRDQLVESLSNPGWSYAQVKDRIELLTDKGTVSYLNDELKSFYLSDFVPENGSVGLSINHMFYLAFLFRNMLPWLEIHHIINGDSIAERSDIEQGLNVFIRELSSVIAEKTFLSDELWIATFVELRRIHAKNPEAIQPGWALFNDKVLASSKEPNNRAISSYFRYHTVDSIFSPGSRLGAIDYLVAYNHKEATIDEGRQILFPNPRLLYEKYSLPVDPKVQVYFQYIRTDKSWAIGRKMTGTTAPALSIPLPVEIKPTLPFIDHQLLVLVSLREGLITLSRGFHTVSNLGVEDRQVYFDDLLNYVFLGENK